MSRLSRGADPENASYVASDSGPSPLVVQQIFALAEPAAQLMDHYRLSSLEYAYGSFRLHLKKQEDLMTQEKVPLVYSPAPSHTPSSSAPKQSADTTVGSPPVSSSALTVTPVHAPMVGTFYMAAKPGEPPFVSQAGLVKEGQTVCIIEAMKTMNTIKAPITGRIHRILLNDAQPVEFGQLLMEITPES